MIAKTQNRELCNGNMQTGIRYYITPIITNPLQRCGRSENRITELFNTPRYYRLAGSISEDPIKIHIVFGTPTPTQSTMK